MSTDQKTCFKCGETKPRSEYYEHPQMGDGLLGKCKECTKKDVRRNRSEATREYDRRRYAERKHEHAARIALNVAISNGNIERPLACWHCGSRDRIEGHHADYKNPLGVVFLCKSCHAEASTAGALRRGLELGRRHDPPNWRGIVNSEHVEVLRVLRDRWAGPDERVALDAAIASLSVPQPPAEAHCATCSCVPGMTPAVRFDTTPAEKEGAVRDHLIRMGWTPPAEAQPVAWSASHALLAEFVDALNVRSEAVTVASKRLKELDARARKMISAAAATAPPSAPVGVEAALRDALQGLIDFIEIDNLPMDADAMFIAKRALAQQPAAVDEAMVERAWEAAMEIKHNKEPWFPMTKRRMKRALTAALATQRGDSHD